MCVHCGNATGGRFIGGAMTESVPLCLSCIGVLIRRNNRYGGQQQPLDLSLPKD